MQRSCVMILAITTLVLGGAGYSPAGAADTNWASYRGSPQMSGATGAFTDRPRLLWTYDTGSEIESTAAIVRDTVYVGTRNNALLALRLSDGKLKWKYIYRICRR